MQLFDSLSENVDRITRLFAEGLNEASENYQNADINKNTTENGGEKFEIREDFKKDFDNWFNNTTEEQRKKDGGRLLLGTTSQKLKSIGVKDYSLYFGKSKIQTILDSHKNITADIIKEAVGLLDNPIIVLQSNTVKDSIVLFGDVYSTDNKPVMMSLLLNPKNKTGEVLDYGVVTSTYSRRKNNIQNLINNTTIYYINDNIKRTDNWLSALGLQLPSAITKYGPIDSIPNPDENVKENEKNSVRTDELIKKYPNLNLNQDISALDGVPAIRLVDGSVLPLDEFNGRRMLHVEFIQKNKIDFQDIESGGWIGNGEYEPSFTSDTQRFVERMAARKKVADLTGEPFDQFKYSSRDEEFRKEYEKVTKQLQKENAKLTEDLKLAKKMVRLQGKVTGGKIFNGKSIQSVGVI